VLDSPHSFFVTLRRFLESFGTVRESRRLDVVRIIRQVLLGDTEAASGGPGMKIEAGSPRARGARSS